MVVLITIGDPFSCLLFSQTESMKRCQTCGWQCTQIELQYRREREREREREKAVKCEDLNDSSSSTPHKLEMMEDNSQKLKISFFWWFSLVSQGWYLHTWQGLPMNTTKK
jgi:hypothetical protein